MMEATEYIDKAQFNKWYGLFKHSGGRLLADPITNSLNRVYVRYEFTDMDRYNTFQTEFLRLTTNIIETKRSAWTRFKVRLGFKP